MLTPPSLCAVTIASHVGATANAVMGDRGVELSTQQTSSARPCDKSQTNTLPRVCADNKRQECTCTPRALGAPPPPPPTAPDGVVCVE
jgi:hypothetical protein